MRNLSKILPKTLKRNIEKHSSLRKIVYPIYSKYLKNYIRVTTWWKTGRHHEAEVSPFRVIEIPPKEVTHKMESGVKFNWSVSGKDLIPKIKSGSWDNRTEPISQNPIYKSCHQVFREESSWEETPLYKNISEKLENSDREHVHGVSQKEDIEIIFENLENLYNDIKENGYKKQSEIENKDFKVHQKPIIDRYLGALNEIAVNIDRNGNFILYDGRHRFSIAKILDLEKIPVRVFARHQKWQQKRDQAIENPENLDNRILKHPDVPKTR